MRVRAFLLNILDWAAVLFLLCGFLLWMAFPLHAQRTNTFYVDQFQGADVAAKTAKAQAACSAVVPCVLIFDPSLAAFPGGVMPAQGANEMWIDYRFVGNPYTPNGSAVVNGTRYASLFPGVDIGAKVNAAIADLGAGGGRVRIPKGSYTFSTPINADSSTGVDIECDGGISGGSPVPTTLVYTGTIPPISARSVTGFRFHGCALFWNNASFAGPVINFAHTGTGCGGGGCDSSLVEIDRNQFAKTGSGAVVPVLMNLDTVIVSNIHHNVFRNYSYAIQGAAASGSYSVRVSIDNNHFSDSTGSCSAAHLANPGESWEVLSNTFEQGTAAGQCGVVAYRNGFTATKAFTFEGNWVGDNTAGASSTLFTVNGVGWSVSGNVLSGAPGGSTTAFNFQSGASGIFIDGNVIQDHATGFVFGGSNHQIYQRGNVLGSVGTLMTGTPASGEMADASNNVSYYRQRTFVDPVILNSDLSVTGQSNLTGRVMISGNGGLPATIGTSLYMASGFGSPTLGRIYVGNGSGWQLGLAKRSASVDTDLFIFKDDGTLTIPGLKSTTGTRYICVDTTGKIVSSATACSGT